MRCVLIGCLVLCFIQKSVQAERFLITSAWTAVGWTGGFFLNMLFVVTSQKQWIQLFLQLSWTVWTESMGFYWNIKNVYILRLLKKCRKLVFFMMQAPDSKRTADHCRLTEGQAVSPLAGFLLGVFQVTLSWMFYSWAAQREIWVLCPFTVLLPSLAVAL